MVVFILLERCNMSINQFTFDNIQIAESFSIAQLQYEQAPLNRWNNSFLFKPTGL